MGCLPAKSCKSMIEMLEKSCKSMVEMLEKSCKSLVNAGNKSHHLTTSPSHHTISLLDADGIRYACLDSLALVDRAQHGERLVEVAERLSELFVKISSRR